MVTLLLVFFVLLYVMTPGIDESKFNDMMSYFQSSTSVVFDKEAASKKQDDGQMREEWQEVQKFLEAQGTLVWYKEFDTREKGRHTDGPLVPRASLVYHESTTWGAFALGLFSTFSPVLKRFSPFFHSH